MIEKEDSFKAIDSSTCCNHIDEWLMAAARGGACLTLLWFNARYATSNPDLNEAEDHCLIMEGETVCTTLPIGDPELPYNFAGEGIDVTAKWLYLCGWGVVLNILPLVFSCFWGAIVIGNKCDVSMGGQ